MDKVIPGILEKDWGEIERKINAVSEATNTFHVDLIDGKFAENQTFTDPSFFTPYSDKFFLEVHLMTDEPINYLDAWSKAGFKRFIGHIEKMSDQAEFVARGQILGEVGLAIDGETPLEDVKVPLDDLDVLLVMTIDAGASGRPFNSACLDKVKKARQLAKFLKIEVDGGINDKTITQAKNEGAERFVATSFIFGSENPKLALGTLTDLV